MLKKGERIDLQEVTEEEDLEIILRGQTRVHEGIGEQPEQWKIWMHLLNMRMFVYNIFRWVYPVYVKLHIMESLVQD